MAFNPGRPPVPPKVLYKYRPFEHRVVEQLCEDQLFFADPSAFNDPLDSRPCVQDDIGIDHLKEVLSNLLRNRESSEMTKAAQSIGYRGPRTTDHIERRVAATVADTLARLAYYATDSEYLGTIPEPHSSLLIGAIEQELLRQYEKGVFSLATRNNCPLMWSHYGEQHKGICIGYSVPATLSTSTLRPQKVSYGGSRVVLASQIKAMLNGDASARDSVDARVLLTKARDWRYEKEWRLIGPRGKNPSPLELVEIIFGMRCPYSVRFTVAKAFEHRGTPVRLYEIRESTGTFKLRKMRFREDDGPDGSYPYRALDQIEASEAFGATSTGTVGTPK